LEHGMIDMIAERKDIPRTIGKLLQYFNKNVVY
jgi:acetyl-CoA carboxylase beta subunit